MPTPLLATKLYIPPPRPNVVRRHRLIARLNEGLHRKLTLISAPAGFGKTTLLASWLAESEKVKGKRQNDVDDRLLPFTFSLLPFEVAWLSLDEGDNDPTRFLAYLVAALQTIAPTIGAGVVGVLQSPQPPPIEAILTALLNDIITLPDHVVLVLDDYHVIDAQPVDQALTFLLEHLPPQLHLVIATREDPQLPLARFRARGQLTELRAADLRFTSDEAAGFLTQMMGLTLAAEDIAALETRTEGWIAGLQLAALSMQGQQDATSFIRSFTGSHHFVLDYLVEEVLHQQSESIQTFLLRTSILDRMCGPLCDAVIGIENENLKIEKTRVKTQHSQFSILNSQLLLQELERANLFIVPLDNERRWYRYHHLFADLLRQRLQQSTVGDAGSGVAELHIRASVWYEDNGLEIEAFHHAAAANDIDHAARLVEGKGMPLFFRGMVAPVLNWLASLPTTVLDARPALWVMYASVLLFASQLTGVEQKLQAAEAALQDVDLDDKTRDLVGHIAAIRATLAVVQNDAETIITQSRRALEYLHHNNLPVRTATTWTLGVAYQLQGDRAAASRAYTEAIAISQMIGHNIITIMATIGLGNIHEAENQLYLATQSYRRVLQLAGDPPLPVACEAHLGLARICYEWNDLDAAQQHGQQSVQLARQIENTDRFVASEVFLARLKLAQGDVTSATAILANAGQLVHQHNFVHQMPEVAAAQVLTLLHQGNLVAAAQLAQTHELPISQARVYLAQGDPSTALAALEPLRRQVDAKGWADERLKVMVLQAVALHAHDEKDKAVHVLGDALALAEPGGFIRIFVDEGTPMAALLAQSAERRAQHDSIRTYAERLLAAFPSELLLETAPTSYAPPVLRSALERSNALVEPLSQRELEVLQLIAEGLTNQEVATKLYLSLHTIKVHARNIYAKLGVKNRTQAAASGKALGILSQT
jgi:LuxR family transcriptional regulator, maltose regulon positive regulatory protein